MSTWTPLGGTPPPRRLELDLPDPADLGPRRPAADARIAAFEAETMLELAAGRPNPDLLLDEVRAPGFPAWMAMRKLAIALHPLHQVPSLSTLGGGLTLADLERPLTGGRDAFAVLADRFGLEQAAAVRGRYAHFLAAPYTPTLRDFMQGGLDARAIRWRAAAATELALDALEGSPRPVRLVSLACGAAGPLARLADALVVRGGTVGEMVLADPDPVALAAGRAIAERHAGAATVRVELMDLLDVRARRAAELAPRLGAGAADVVDILGLFEYLPDRFAVDLLVRARELLRPGGVILLANMRDERPQQDVFRHVIQWPRLVQRSESVLLELAGRAGFAPESVVLGVPPAVQSVYTVVALRRDPVRLRVAA